MESAIGLRRVGAGFGQPALPLLGKVEIPEGILLQISCVDPNMNAEALVNSIFISLLLILLSVIEESLLQALG